MATIKIKGVCVNAILVFSLVLLSCCGKGERTIQHQRPKVEVAETLRTDSFKCSIENEYGSCEVYIDYPVSGPKAAVSAIRQFILVQLLKEQTQNVSDSPDEMAKIYCERQLGRFKATLDQMGLPPPPRSEAPEDGLEIRYLNGPDKWATFEVFHFSYLTGGGHGEYSQYGITFRLSDGKRLSYNDILEPMNEHLFALLREGMMQYFEISSDKELKG